MATVTKKGSGRPAGASPAPASAGSTVRPRNAGMPVLRVTRYDRVSSWMISIVIAMVFVVIAVVIWWYSTRPPAPPILVPLELVEDPGGFEDGNPDETLQVDSPLEETPNASLAEEQLDENVQETLDTVMELSDRAAEQVEQVQTAEPEIGGTPGSHTGTGGRPLGSGNGSGGFPREQRWFVSFNDSGSLDEYGKQLDFFGIELGAVFPSRGEIVYLSKLGTNPPTQRVVKISPAEQRLYMSWQGGERKQADIKMFQRAGVDISGAKLVQFYPKQTEDMLARLELNYANRAARDIRRTYFTIQTSRNGYSFVVSRQTYLR